MAAAELRCAGVPDHHSRSQDVHGGLGRTEVHNCSVTGCLALGKLLHPVGSQRVQRRYLRSSCKGRQVAERKSGSALGNSVSGTSGTGMILGCQVISVPEVPDTEFSSQRGIV